MIWVQGTGGVGRVGCEEGALTLSSFASEPLACCSLAGGCQHR